MSKFKLTFLFKVFCGLVFSWQAHAQLWTAEQSWTEDHEKKFSAWVQNDVSEEFFHDIHLETDCADAIISLRWIFARENKLPMASTNGQGTLISHLSKNWNTLSTSDDWRSDRRFLKALQDINTATSTRTLLKDLYPVSIDRKNLQPGTVYITSNTDSGHAEWISKVDMMGSRIPITFYSSTVPRQVRRLLVYPLTKTKWPEKNQSGFAKFRWPVVKAGQVALTESRQMPNYSQEQYENSARQTMDFDDFIAERVLGHSLDGLNKFFSLTSHLVDRFEKRASIVTAGFEACRKGCREGGSDFYNHSTYSRDSSILMVIQGINEMIYSSGFRANVDDRIASEIQQRWSEVQTTTQVNVGFRQAQLGELVMIWNQNRFSSNPNDSVVKRWGF